MLRGDVLSLPLRDGSVNAVVCVAVLGHLASLDRRRACVAELLRVLSVGGRLLLVVWAKEQRDASKRRFDAYDSSKSDFLVPWAVPGEHREGETHHLRFYHVFRKGELEALVEEASPLGKVISVEYDGKGGNWLLIVEKQNL